MSGVSADDFYRCCRLANCKLNCPDAGIATGRDKHASAL